MGHSAERGIGGCHIYDIGPSSSDDSADRREPDGPLIGKLKVAVVVANVACGGPKRHRLLICGTTSLYTVLLAVNVAKTL